MYQISIKSNQTYLASPPRWSSVVVTCELGRSAFYPKLSKGHPMRNLENLPLDHAQLRREQLERELRKCPDFQLYLITKTRDDRARMEHVLMENPAFKLWRLLTNSMAMAGAGGPRPLDDRDARPGSAA
jgi:hypothetical protein